MTYPFLTPAWLEALQHSGAVATTAAEALHGSGWWRVAGPDGLPLYGKWHSRGEYVFDQPWADAWHRHGRAYYPKLVTAVPYTPVEGPRWQGLSGVQVRQAVEDAADHLQASGWHLLFADARTRDELSEWPLIPRLACHYRWFNRGAEDFEAFLGTFMSRKRKMVRKERRRVQEQGIRVERRVGEAIPAAWWEAFLSCYARTYHLRGQVPYLNPAFFRAVASALAAQTLMVAALWQDQVVATALYWFDGQGLYGRYWGARADLDALHFELCYYQGIEFAIERGLAVFDPGVQGEHKLLRGFEPVLTTSLHWLRDPALHRAVADFCAREAEAVRQDQAALRDWLPFRRD